jgi:hypothetical protein
MGKTFLEELMEKYSLDKPVYTKDKWERITDLKDFSLDFDNNIKYTYYNYDLMDTDREDVWNGEIKSLKEFEIEEKYIKAISSDYYTTLSIIKELEENTDHYRREGVIENGFIELSNSLSVMSTVFLDLEEGSKIVYHKRSENTEEYPLHFSSVPNGKVDSNHSSLMDCVVEEFREELLGDKNELIEELDFDVYYTGTCIPIKQLSFQITSIIHLKQKDARKALESFQKNEESFDIFIDGVSEFKSKLGEDITIHNSSPGGYYCLSRAIDFIEKL